MQASSSSRGNESNSLEGLRKSIKDLEYAQEEPLVRFLHLITDKLLMLLVRPPAAAVGRDLSAITLIETINWKSRTLNTVKQRALKNE